MIVDEKTFETCHQYPEKRKTSKSHPSWKAGRKMPDTTRRFGSRDSHAMAEGIEKVS